MTNIWISSTFPDYPSVKSYKKNMKDIEFPISFKLCVRELGTTMRYSRYGYSDEYDFFEGRSLFNRSFLGWNGFSETNSTIGFTQGISFDKSNKHYCLGALMKDSAEMQSVCLFISSSVHLSLSVTLIAHRLRYTVYPNIKI